MPSHQEKKILPYSCEQVFDLVMDIEKYPDFLPWCVGSRITEKNDEFVKADLIIGYKMFRETFTSQVYFKRPETITVSYQSGPMQDLRNYWRLRSMPNGHCEVDFYVDFEFKSKVFQGLASMFFNEIVKRMVDGFEKRADTLYGDGKHGDVKS